MLSLLRMRLHQAIDGQSAVTEVTAADRLPTTQRCLMTQYERSHLDRTLQVIPIKRVNKATPFVYVCAIAHRLATPSQPAAMIAAQLANTMQANANQSNQRDAFDDRDTLASGLVIKATATGLLQFELGDRAIAAWLDELLAKPLRPFESIATLEPSIVPPAAVFKVQYAHARCCSLLRLAHREALIMLDKVDEAPLYWRIVSPASVPWLTSTTAQLCLKHPVDRDLLGHLVEALDCLSDDSWRRTQRTLRSAHAIAQAMEAFHRVHPLWRKTGVEPTLVASQCGLLMATQRILHLLLAEGLHLDPAIEL